MRQRVLIIDNGTGSQADELSDFLTGYGLEVDIEYDPEDGLVALGKNGRFHAVLVAAHFPLGRYEAGVEVTRSIRVRKPRMRILIYDFGCERDRSFRQRALKAGAQAVIFEAGTRRAQEKLLEKLTS